MKFRELAKQLIEKYLGMFSEDFEKNKELVNQVTTIKYKKVKNILAGEIVRYIRRLKTPVSGREDR